MPVQQSPVGTENGHEHETQDVQSGSSHSHNASSYTGPRSVEGAPPGLAKMLVGGVLLVLITAGIITFLNRKSETDALAKETDAVAVPTVAVVHPQSEAANDELVLPGG